jgi:hypothetical protein
MKMLTFSRKVRGLERIERNGAHPVADRARRYVEKMPSAISGSGGHDALFPVACVLTNGFALSNEQAWSILQEYNARCQPPWSQRELRHKLSEAKVSHLKPLGHLLRKTGEITPPPSASPRVLGRITLPDTAEGDPVTSKHRRSESQPWRRLFPRRVFEQRIAWHRAPPKACALLVATFPSSIPQPVEGASRCANEFR